MLDAARRDRDAVAAVLNTILGRAIDSPWPPLQLPSKPLPVPISTAEVARIPHLNPKVRALQELAASAKAESRIANRAALPQLSFGVDARMDAASGNARSATLGFKLNLPWFQDPVYQSAIDAAKARENAMANEIAAARREITAEVITAITQASNAAAQAHAYAGEILQKATDARSAAEAAWIHSNAPLANLLDSARQLAAIRLEQRRMVAMQLSALETLHSLLPTPNSP